MTRPQNKMNETNYKSMAAKAPKSEEIQATIKNYTQIMDNQMKPMLHKTLERKEVTLRKLSELEQTQTSLRALELTLEESLTTSSDGLEEGEKAPILQTRVNIGEEFYMRANVYNADAIIVDMGSGILVEMTMPEAKKFFTRKKALLQAVLQATKSTITELEDQLQKMATHISELTPMSPTFT